MNKRTTARTSIRPRLVLLKVEVGNRFLYEHERLVMGLSFALARASDKDRALTDRDVLAGISTLARSYERLVNSGLHYDEPTQGITQRRPLRCRP